MTRIIRSAPSLAAMYEARGADRSTRVTIFVNGISRIGYFNPEDLHETYARFHFGLPEAEAETDRVHMVRLADISEITFPSR